ncbi:MAG: hypothetical protein M3405_01910 [Acidobacteriota bacterium]|nr:hypothetical protein [Acidobacteriota bacterium]
MEMNITQRPKWKFPLVEAFIYQENFLHYFIKHNPGFWKDVKNIYQFHFDIFGRHEQMTPRLSEHNWMLTPAISEKDYLFFSNLIETKLRVFNYDVINQNDFSKEKLKVKTDILLNKITDIIERYNLFFGSYHNTFESLWIFHLLICQIETGANQFGLPMRHLAYELPIEMLKGLYRELPELDQNLLVENQKNYYINIGDFQDKKHWFENFDTYIENFPFKTLPQPAMFDVREFNIYEDIKEYEKLAIKAFTEHIKQYTKRMSDALNEYGFKQNQKDDYSQTEWLAIWNKHGFTYLWEIFPYIEDFQNIDSNNKRQKISAEDRLRKAFNKFETFDLPVRPFGKKRKNSE